MKNLIKLHYFCFAFILLYSCEKNINSNLLTDADGNTYDTLIIGTQTWMKGNLKVTHYRNSDPIPNVTDATAWTSLTTGAYCNYDNDPNYVKINGRLYNWYTVADPRGLCPSGWHIPNNMDWITLAIYLGGEYAAPKKIINRGLSTYSGGRGDNGIYGNIDVYALWWTPEEHGTLEARPIMMIKAINSITAGYDSSAPKKSGYSVLCLKD